jgi:HEAT repeat protein
MKLTNDPVRQGLAQLIGKPVLPLPDIFPMVRHESTVGAPICTIDCHLPQLADENTRAEPEDLGIMTDGNHPNPGSFLEFVVRRTVLDLAWKLYAQTADPAEFIDQLADPHQSQNAASVLWRMGPRALAPLSTALTDLDAHVREYAAIVLGCFGAQANQLIPELAALLQREHPPNSGHCRPCGAAAFALGRMMPNSQETLLDLVRGDQTTAASYAAAQLARFPSAEIIAALTDCLNDPRQHVWTAAAFALGKIGPSAVAALPALRQKFRAQDSTEGTLTVALALEQIAPETGETTRWLLEMINDEDAHVRESAIMATRTLLESARDSRVSRSRDLDPVIQKLVSARESEAGVRRETVRCLGLVAGPAESVLSALQAALADEDPSVQNDAALALANHGRLGIRHFNVALRHVTPSARRWAAFGLGQINAEDAQQEAADLLIQALNDSHATVRTAAAESLDRVFNRRRYSNGVPAPSPAQSGIPKLRALLADPDPEPRVQAALTLVDLGVSAPEVQGVLREAVAVPSLSPELQSRVRVALQRNK